MRRGSLPGSLSLFAALLLTACSTAPPPPASAVVVTADARALQYGANAPEVLNNPRLAPQLRALFGPDWNRATAFFPDFSTIRMVRVEGREYVGIFGCIPTGCQTYRGLLLIANESQIQARLDDGGFSHYYDYGPTVGNPQAKSTIDGAWYAIEAVERK
jgi:hypothetical protein